MLALTLAGAVGVYLSGRGSDDEKSLSPAQTTTVVRDTCVHWFESRENSQAQADHDAVLAEAEAAGFDVRERFSEAGLSPAEQRLVSRFLGTLESSNEAAAVDAGTAADRLRDVPENAPERDLHGAFATLAGTASIDEQSAAYDVVIKWCKPHIAPDAG